MCSNNGYVPNIHQQLRYVTFWFQEWSEMQRSDFLPILVERLGDKCIVNGLLTGMVNSLGNLEDRPPNLFQCRVKLFRQWSENWGQAEKDQLLSSIKAMDPDFMKKFEEEVSSANLKPTADCEDNIEESSASNLNDGAAGVNEVVENENIE